MYIPIPSLCEQPLSLSLPKLPNSPGPTEGRGISPSLASVPAPHSSEAVPGSSLARMSSFLRVASYAWALCPLCTRLLFKLSAVLHEGVLRNPLADILLLRLFLLPVLIKPNGLTFPNPSPTPTLPKLQTYPDTHCTCALPKLSSLFMSHLGHPNQENGIPTSGSSTSACKHSLNPAKPAS